MLNARPAVATIASLLIAPAALAAVSAAAPTSRPATRNFAGVDAAVARAIDEGKCPGAVVLVGDGDAVAYFRAYGDVSVQPTTRPMRDDAIFDLASLSKVVGTATSAMVLLDRGLIDLAAPVAKYLPEFGNNGKAAITVEQLLTHTSGLVADNPMTDYVDGPAKAIERIMASKPASPVGSKYVYSDVNFIVLGKLVERVGGKPLDRFAHDEVFAPLGMTDTAYNPPAAWRDRIAPTEKRNGAWIVGEVHDPRAYALGGVAGHAGVFSTARDVARWVRMINNGGALDGTRILSEATVKNMLTPRPLPDGKGSRGLGVDVDSPYAPSPRGDRFPAGTTFGHTGWTGTSLWSDPAVKRVRRHPDQPRPPRRQGQRRHAPPRGRDRRRRATAGPGDDASSDPTDDGEVGLRRWR